MLDKMKGAVMNRAMKLMTDPRVMKALSSPRVTQLIMQGMMLKGKVDEFMDDRTGFLARQLNLATREEVEALREELDSIQKP